MLGNSILPRSNPVGNAPATAPDQAQPHPADDNLISLWLVMSLMDADQLVMTFHAAHFNGEFDRARAALVELLDRQEAGVR